MLSSLLYITYTILLFLGHPSISFETLPTLIWLYSLTVKTWHHASGGAEICICKETFQIFDLGWISPLSRTMTNHSEAQVGNFVNFELN